MPPKVEHFIGADVGSFAPYVPRSAAEGAYRERLHRAINCGRPSRIIRADAPMERLPRLERHLEQQDDESQHEAGRNVKQETPSHDSRTTSG